MAESVIADFVGKFNSEGLNRGDPITGRVVLSQKRLVLAANRDAKSTIPLGSIFDIAVGHIPPDLGEFFDSTVTVAFERNGDRYVAVVEADDDKITKFSTVLFKAILNGTEMTLKHPAKVGGRVTGAEFQPARLSVAPGRVAFTHGEGRTGISLASVTDFQRDATEIAGQRRPVLKVRHMADGQALTTLAATDSPRKMSILGRYLRLEYSDLMADLAAVDVSPEGKELLVAIYSGAGGGGGVSLAKVLDLEGSQVTVLLHQLANEGLVVDTEDGTELTPQGQIYVNHHLEDVNA
jgi:helix-turn-helix protein